MKTQDNMDGQPAPVFLEPFPHPRNLAQMDRPGLHAPGFHYSPCPHRYARRISPIPTNYPARHCYTLLSQTILRHCLFSQSYLHTTHNTASLNSC